MALNEVAMLAAARGADFSCPPLIDISQVWSRINQRWLIIGEDHGTNEQPEIFLGSVCQASAKRKVTVAVEQPASEQSAIDAFVYSDEGKQLGLAFYPDRFGAVASRTVDQVKPICVFSTNLDCSGKPVGSPQ